ncbi:hypothetical protein [Acinetobacter brisouii]
MKIHSQPIDLRDYFATAAMQGELSGQSAELTWSNEQHLAERAYVVADAMIAEREKGSVESADQIKQMLVSKINELHPSICPSLNLSAEQLIFQLTTGKPF